MAVSSTSFKPGDPRINRKGRLPNADKDLLRAALQREGEKRGKPFWEKVAEAAYDNPSLMSAICKKFVPDMSQTEHSGEVHVTEMPTIKVDGEPLEFDIGSDPGSSTDAEHPTEASAGGDGV